MNVNIGCDPCDDGCDLFAEPEFPHEFTYCDLGEALLPELDFKEVFPYYNIEYPPAAGVEICVYRNITKYGGIV